MHGPNCISLVLRFGGSLLNDLEPNGFPEFEINAATVFPAFWLCYMLRASSASGVFNKFGAASYPQSCI